LYVDGGEPAGATATSSPRSFTHAVGVPIRGDPNEQQSHAARKRCNVTCAFSDHVAGVSHLTLFTMNGFGELSDPVTIAAGTANANGVAIMPASDADDAAQ